MKKQIMSLAVTGALLGGAVAANAEMHVNDRGLGEALIYPFYSAANGNDTYIHLVNTTSLVKAVKVRFIEAQNSQEVLDFNLYLSPEDEWTGAITANPADGATGAVIRTVDNSCTVPELGTAGGANTGELAGTQTVREDGSIVRDQPFVNFKYVNAEDEVDTGLSRTMEGYIEVIEMGQLYPDDGGKGEAAVHDESGTPEACGDLVAAWSSSTTGNETTEGDWLDDSQDELLTTWDGGGLYGYGVVINVADGTAAGYDAIAIETFYDAILAPDLHEVPGLEFPSLAEANSAVTIFDEGVSTDYFMDDGADAVSALFMTAGIHNDYVVDPDINAATDWVVTMPTKRFYVQGDPDEFATPPFTSNWDGAGACEPVGIEHWDREEAYVPPPTLNEGPVFSPQPPTIDPELDDFNLCTEVSVISFGEESALNATDSIRYGFTPDHTEGWATLSFDPSDLNNDDDLSPDARMLYDDSSNVFYGLPAVGFAVFNYQNGVLGEGVLANYAAASEHKSEIEVGSD